MDVSFKNMSNKTISIQVDPNDKLESVIPKLMEQNEIDPEKNTIKFIFKGRVLNNSSTFQEFKDEKQLTIIYMVSKNKSESSNAQKQEVKIEANQELSNVQKQEVKIEPVHENLNQNVNEVDRLRASIIATLFFIRQTPQFTELFMNNFPALLEIMSSDQLRPLFERIYNDTTEISDSEYINDMTENVSDVSSQSNDLTEQDKNNIDTLVSLGFPKNASIQAYLLCNKNVELAASMLMDN
jgi:hypothetical protein